jgi:hypothetical protein
MIRRRGSVAAVVRMPDNHITGSGMRGINEIALRITGPAMAG